MVSGFVPRPRSKLYICMYDIKTVERWMSETVTLWMCPDNNARACSQGQASLCYSVVTNIIVILSFRWFITHLWVEPHHRRFYWICAKLCKFLIISIWEFLEFCVLQKGSPSSFRIHSMANLNVLRLVLCCYEGCSTAAKYFAVKQWRYSGSLLIWNNYNYHGIFCNIKLGTNTLQNPLHAIPDLQASRLSGRAPGPDWQRILKP